MSLDSLDRFSFGLGGVVSDISDFCRELVAALAEGQRRAVYVLASQ
jgi:hypothetical protein